MTDGISGAVNDSFSLYKIGTTIWIASSLGYIAGLSNSFYFGKVWVFNPERVVFKHAIIKFILIYDIIGSL